MVAISTIEFGNDKDGQPLAIVTFLVSDHRAHGVVVEPFKVAIAVDAEGRDYAAIVRSAEIGFRQLMSSLAEEPLG